MPTNWRTELFGQSLDDLSRPSRELLRLVYQHVQRQAAASKTGNVTFNRRELREAFKWGDTRLRIHLDELVEMEYVVPLSGRFGQTYQYRLVYDADRRAGAFSFRPQIGGAVAQNGQPRRCFDPPRTPKRAPRTHLAGANPRG